MAFIYFLILLQIFQVTSKLENMQKFLGASTASKSSSASTINGVNGGKDTSVAGWMQKDSLLVFTSQDVKASAKVLFAGGPSTTALSHKLIYC